MKTWRALRGIIAGVGLLGVVVAQTPLEEEELESQLVGVERPFGDGQFMGLAIEGNALMLRFYDEEKQLIEPQAARASAWWKPSNRTGRERVVLNPSDDGLRSQPKVRPPHVFFVMLTLLNDEGASMGTHRFDMIELREASESAGGAGPGSRY